ncbi:MAG: NADH-quinone oxidoreductase subunit K [Desulfovibrionaceae bacterium]|nr:NADH-quinone oxidoreductase subunit K [Desulfovibrionaceae bacterium]MBF0512520.1 NADH-quinone oxidoreductase subunit K [Desulfovibrionaceae bacterium]
MSDMVLFQLTALALLAIGLFGMLSRRSLVGMLICVELMLNGAGLSIVSASQFSGTGEALGQAAALLVMGLAAAEATLVLVIILVVAKRFGNAESSAVSILKG